MIIYAHFFTPSSLSLLFCLHEVSQPDNRDARSPLLQYLINKILTITEADCRITSNAQFQAELLSATNNVQFLQLYQSIIRRITCFNDFYRQVSKMLKSLRAQRNNKLEQGNLIDFLVRRMYIYFQKLDFQEIVQIYQHFTCYLEGQPFSIPQHEFMLTKSIEQVKFNLENYSKEVGGERVGEEVRGLAEYDHTAKTSYLQGLLGCMEGRGVAAEGAMHRYFDRSLGNLFQQKSQVSLISSNKINHCILSVAYLSLQMGGLQQCLQAISQGLRISQNNSDEQSINNCIIYLYRISEELGKHQEQMLLGEHAITHSLNLSNTLLMVFSCWNYSRWEEHYNCADPNLALMKNRSIHWTDALHFSHKKIYNTFESTCKNIYHLTRSLLLPTFLTKLTVLTHLPQLRPLLLNPYYQRPELTSLDLYQQHTRNTPLNQHIQRVLQYQKNGQYRLMSRAARELHHTEQKARSPLEIVSIKNCLNRVAEEDEGAVEIYHRHQQLIYFCQQHGLVKGELMEPTVRVAQLLMQHGLLHDAKVRLQHALQHAQLHHMQPETIVCRLLIAQAGLKLGEGADEAAETVSRIEHQGQLSTLKGEYQSVFQQTKGLLAETVEGMLQDGMEEERRELRRVRVECLEAVLRIQWQQDDLRGMSATARALCECGEGRWRGMRDYLSKALGVFGGVEHKQYDEGELQRRIRLKLQRMM